MFFALITKLRKVLPIKVSHSAKKTNEHENLQTSHVHKKNWNFGIFLWVTLFFPYKSTAYAVPILRNKLEFDWNPRQPFWNRVRVIITLRDVSMSVPIFWNKFQFFGIVLEFWNRASAYPDALFKRPSVPTPRVRVITRAKTKNWSQKRETKKYRQTFRLGGMGEIII